MTSNFKVGLTYYPQLKPFFESHPNIVDILEIEPQTFWIHNSKKKQYLVSEDLKEITSLKYPKLIHSVGCPIGTSTLNKDQIPFLKEMIAILNPEWISEHLNFNRVITKKEKFWTGFLLPPLQNEQGIKTYVKNILLLEREFKIPFAIENGTNYLKVWNGEITDGSFVGQIINQSKCGLVLDIHNLLTNELNGRQTIEDFLKEIPLEMVWEIHVSGGEEKYGYWIDSHSDTVPKKLIKLLIYIVPKLVNLKAIVFEIEPSRINTLNSKSVYSFLKILHSFKRLTYGLPKSSKSFKDLTQIDNTQSVMEWEQDLGYAINGKQSKVKFDSILKDPGIEIYRKLVFTNRIALLLKTLRYTTRLLMLVLGMDQYKRFVHFYFESNFAKLFASDEGLQFAKYLRNTKIPYLKEILKLEVALIKSAVSNTEILRTFEYDILQIIREVDMYRIPNTIEKKHLKILISAGGKKMKIL